MEFPAGFRIEDYLCPIIIISSLLALFLFPLFYIYLYFILFFCFFPLFLSFALTGFVALVFKCPSKIVAPVRIRVWQVVMSSVDHFVSHHYSYPIFHTNTKKNSLIIQKMPLSGLPSAGLNNGSRTLRFTKDGTFKISIFSDLHYGECVSREEHPFLQ